MKNNHRIPRQAVLLGCAALVTAGLAACSSSPHATPSASASDRTATSTTESAELPLDAYLSGLTGLSGSYADVQEKKYQQDLKRERIIATCMKESGFSYTPEATKNTSKSGQYGPSDRDLDSMSWVQKYGYGAVYQPEGTTGAIDREAAEQGNAKTSGTVPQTPNRQYRASLSAGERAAYDKAMDGDAGDDPSLTITKDWKRFGCTGLALHTVPNQNVIMGSAEGKTVEEAIELFENGYASWPGIADAAKAWSSCMSDAGFAGYTNQNQPSSQLAGENTELWETAGSDGQPSTADLDALAKKERTIALADLNCRNKTHYRTTIRAITITQQKQFMADNRVALDALAASIRSGSK